MTTTNHTSPIGEDAANGETCTYPRCACAQACASRANGAIGERKAFEEWAKSKGLKFTCHAAHDYYSPHEVQCYYEVWQARAALTAEKVAAQVVDSAIVDCDIDMARAVRAATHEVSLDPYMGAPQPAQTQVALSDADMLALIRKVEDKLGIVWFVPDDSGRCLWRTTDTEERNKFVRTLLSMHSAPTNAIGDAARDVIVERQRQMSAEGWTPEHDDEHEIGELARAAACYAANATGFRLQSRLNIWPWDREWWKPTTPRRDLIKAGALILAEIERIDRAAVQPAGGTDHE